MTEVAIRQDSEPEIDGELLEEAQRQIGAASPNEAINAALRELVESRRARRREALAELRRMSDEGRFDYEALEAVDE
jgi:Arc/MetJ family transcription regulator